MNEHSNAYQLIRLSGYQNHRCAYCHHDMILPNGMRYDRLPFGIATKEHVVPYSMSRDDSEENLVVSCNLCNLLRNTMDCIRYLTIVQQLHTSPFIRESWHTFDATSFKIVLKVFHAEQFFYRALSSTESAYSYHERMRALEERIHEEPWCIFVRIVSEGPDYIQSLQSYMAKLRAVSLHMYLKGNLL